MNTRAFLESKRLLAKYHWGRLWFRPKVIFSIKTLLTNPRDILGTLYGTLQSGFATAPATNSACSASMRPKGRPVRLSHAIASPGRNFPALHW